MRSARLRASGPRELPGDRHVSSGVSRVAVNVPADAAAPFYSISCILPCYKSYYAALKPHNPPEKKRRTIFQFLDISKVCRACNLDQMCPTPARGHSPRRPGAGCSEEQRCCCGTLPRCPQRTHCKRPADGDPIAASPQSGQHTHTHGQASQGRDALHSSAHEPA